jgi:hypothetical protein
MGGIRSTSVYLTAQPSRSQRRRKATFYSSMAATMPTIPIARARPSRLPWLLRKKTRSDMSILTKGPEPLEAVTGPTRGPDR